ncbi:3-hydroxyisobutyryl-CoA hydrolase [Gordonia sp. HY002]|uniref:3-hydroxyisobutyryl-CoA hydrolase n=1 Tax=Gordonia zhenghanii TaxID=2911516 RepID=UPI001EF0494B|nr:3-hydroxyisobutyryl-CoA hydrolase [Gordonia zhenghanii]MCF8571596.1 3-hydroxyisobutyryl-CoA hydrolase [Gordonia zhenghanii]MCF8602193.1 3-hydroxyisobutyryl-CoA hydrolase [Gordonia zhenghanii]
MPADTDSPAVVTTVTGRAGVITLNRPRSINALDHEMVQSMDATLVAWADDDAIDVVVVRGAGDRGLCAGGDIVAIHRDANALAGAGDEAAAASDSAAFWRDEYVMNARIGEYPKPYVALMDGIVMGGGVGVCGHANTRIVTERTRLAMPEVGIGLVPDVGGTWLLSHVADELGTYAALTTTHLRGGDVMALGLADHFVPSEDLDALVDALADRPLDDVLTEFAQTPPDSEVAGGRDWIKTVFAADTVAQILENCIATATPEGFATAEAIEGKSPAALAATLSALRAAANDGSLRESLVREYRSSLRCLQHPDLAEGIRAQVIDKDRKPAWKTGPVDADAFTAPLPDHLELKL